MEYKVAIPSYRRADLLKRATLATLERYGVTKDKITIFVANENERAEYETVLGKDYSLQIGVLGLVEQRRFYHNWYPKDTPLLEICDDVTDIHQLGDKKLEPYSGTLDELAEMMFGICERTGARLWGINPVSNHFFMDNTISVGLRLIYGTIFGSYAGDEVFTGSRVMDSSSAEDFENSIKSFLRYGAVVRNDYLTPISKLFTTPGGLETMLRETKNTDRMTEHRKHLEAIVDAFPEICSLYTKAGDVPNIRLKRITHIKLPRVA